MSKKKRSHKKRTRKATKATLLGRKIKKTVWLNILPQDLWLEVSRGTILLKVLQKADFDVVGDCGGLGKCGKCKVHILTSTDYPSPIESCGLLSEDEIRKGIRLACRTRLNKDMAIWMGGEEDQPPFYQILKTGVVPVLEIDPLVEHHWVELELGLQNDGRSNFKVLKSALGSGYQYLQGTLPALNALDGRLESQQLFGTATIERDKLLAWHPGAEQEGYGLVFDLGTSTVVAKLIRLRDGRQMAAVSCLNSQNKYGADVISRLQHVLTHNRGLEQLHQLLIRDLNKLIDRLIELCDQGGDDISIIVAAGNTTMQHFLLNLDPSGIAKAPFAPVVSDSLICRAAETGLNFNESAQLYLMPAKSGYIGGDLVSAILASQVAEQDEKVILGMDLGTNGEIFLGNSRRLLTCSAAAGPALEGAKITHGTIAKGGAIEGVRFLDGILHYKTIGNIKPTGICGSGLVDLVAMLSNLGIIDNQGLITVPEIDPGLEGLPDRLIEEDGVYNFVVVPAEEASNHKAILLTQKDVRELQYAKAAIAAGIHILCDEWGLERSEIDQVCLAGALGNYINPYSAIRLGLIPILPPVRVVSLGNAASTGAAMALLAKGYWQMAAELVRKIEHVELSNRADFSQHFVDNMDFPEENIWDRRVAVSDEHQQ